MKKVYIIAEAGVNHNGNLDLAKQLIDAAAKAGADAVKFQSFKADNLCTSKAPKADYQIIHDTQSTSQLDMLRRLELSLDDQMILYHYAIKKGLDFLSTPFDIESAQFLNTLNLKYMKIPSGEITNYPYLREIASYKKPIILSTGMCTLDDVKTAITTLQSFGTSLKNIILLHCTSEYPAPLENINLNAMLKMKKEFGVEIGYSDHTQGIEISIAAVALGATVIEKHFTLDKNLPGPDHQASLNPLELTNMISSIRNIEKAMGNPQKSPSSNELLIANNVRKSIVAAQNITSGEKFTEHNLTTKRPGTGLSPMKWNEIIGTLSLKNYKKDDQI
ncbi:MAG: N-acetylneuraminate synthase [Bdellovibrionales bacterium RIFOXYB1_FULL_37_110]|nr:MAG: N-acetylneuraminate synthase [Bdellovibrionales bacterium RIFOXYC1_FULL_37_79]OFZ58827.1 MAG: N-acetylneuraminate synthase [Bdellovibrionales bacterium RIFOXYB1_FULL_37_110]OFZ64826.1 MAG: N-acetylneuraminate synthase [Bdellovibrionales bacterium RIFOXYD1_FULL_36_51]